MAQGWGYGAVQDITRRNPRLVPYRLLDEATKRSSATASARLRAPWSYGCNIEPPDQEPSEVLTAGPDLSLDSSL